MYKLSNITRINITKEDGTRVLMTWDEADAYIRANNPMWSDLADVLRETGIPETRKGEYFTTVVLKGERFLRAVYTAVKEGFIQMVDGYIPRDVYLSEIDVLPGQIAFGDEFDKLEIAYLEDELKRLKSEG